MNRQKVDILEHISFKKILWGIIFGLISALLLAIVTALLINGQVISEKYIKLLAGISLFLAGGISSFVSCGKRKMIISAALSAFGVFAILWLIGLVFFPGELVGLSALIIVAILLGSAALGSFISSYVK